MKKAAIIIILVAYSMGLGIACYQHGKHVADSWATAHPVVKEEGQVLKPGWSRAIVTVHEPLAYHVAFEFLDGRREIYMACFSTPVRSLLDGQKIDVVYKLSDEDKDGNCLHIDSYLPVPAPHKKAKPAKARPCNQIGFTHTSCDYAQTPLDLPAKEIINEHAFGNTKPCDPPLPADSMISCFEWVPVHEGWTCEDKQRILQQSEDGKLHCILPAAKP